MEQVRGQRLGRRRGVASDRGTHSLWRQLFEKRLLDDCTNSSQNVADVGR